MIKPKDAMLYPNATIDYDGEILNIFSYLQKFSIVIESGKIPMNCKLNLRSVKSLTDEEKKIIGGFLISEVYMSNPKIVPTVDSMIIVCCHDKKIKLINYLHSINIYLKDLPDGTYTLDGKAVAE